MGQPRIMIGKADGPPLADPAADVVDVLIVQDGEQPCAQIRPSAPQMGPTQGSRDAVLNQVLSPGCVARERPGVAPQARNFLLNHSANVRHSPELSLLCIAVARFITIQTAKRPIPGT